MNRLLIMLVFLAGMGAICFGYFGFKHYRLLTESPQKIGFAVILSISLEYGLAAALTFFTFIMAAGVLDLSYHWTVRSLLSSLVLSVAGGVITTLGSLYQIYTTIQYKETITGTFKKEKK